MIISIIGTNVLELALTGAIIYLIKFVTGKKIPVKIVFIVYLAVICEVCIINLLISCIGKA